MDTPIWEHFVEEGDWVLSRLVTLDSGAKVVQVQAFPSETGEVYVDLPMSVGGVESMYRLRCQYTPGEQALALVSVEALP